MKSFSVKKVLTAVSWGILIGFIAGFIRGTAVIIMENYLPQGLARLAFERLALYVLQGVTAGAAVFLVLFLLFFVFTRLWKKIVPAYFHINVTPVKNTHHLWKAVIPALLVLYGLFETVRFFSGSSSGLRILLLKLSAVLFASLLAVRLFPKNFSAFRKKFTKKIKGHAPRRTAAVLLGLTAALFLFQKADTVLFPPRGPNVIVIMADALRADHLGCYGYHRPTTPYIDAFAREAVLFEKMISNAPWTKPSIACLFTSLYPHENGILNWMADLDSKNLTLAEAFKNRKYTTAGFHANPIVTARHNFQQGFDIYEEFDLEECDKVAEAFLEWLPRHKDEAFFAYLHFMDNHLPYNPPEETLSILEPEGSSSPVPGMANAFTLRMLTYMGLSDEDKQHLINLYDAELIDFDRKFQKILLAVEELGLADNTIIVLTADHGEELWDHGGFEHGHSVYNELLHVPLIIKGPHYPAKRVTSFAQTIDLFPTLMTLSGGEGPQDVRGKDLTGLLLEAEREKPSEEIFIEATLNDDQKRALIKNGWKIIHNTGKFFKDTFPSLRELSPILSGEPEESYELYDLNTDFHEKNNLILKRPDIAKALTIRLQLISSPLFGRSRGKTKEKTEKTIRQKKLEDLKSLGYIK